MLLKSKMLVITIIIFVVISLAVGIGLAISESSQSTAPSSSTVNILNTSGEEVAAIITITVSGTVTGPGGPAADVDILLNTFIEQVATTTDNNGFYSASIDLDDILILHFRPPLEEPLLAQANYRFDNLTGDLSHDVLLPEANLLDITVENSAGEVISTGVHLDIENLSHKLPPYQWYMLEESSGTYKAAVAPDIYYVSAPNPPSGSYRTTQAYDLRTTNQSVTMTLHDSYVHPIPYEPPEASKITIGPPNDLGEAIVTGTSGAALPLAQLILVNLSTTHQSDAISEADGSFSARIYAPPGSAIQIKHGPASHRWAGLDTGVSEGINPFPGTIIHAPYEYDDGDPGTLSFATAGLVEGFADDKITTTGYVGAAWAVTGTMEHIAFDGAWTRVVSGTYQGQSIPGLYLGGLNWTHPALADLDGDDDLDLLVGERSGSLVLYRNEGSVSAPTWQFEEANYGGIDELDWLYPALADVTNDGAPDLLVGLSSGEVDIYYNQGTAAAPAWPSSPQETLKAGANPAPALADLDNDNDLDLLVGHTGGTLILFKNNGTPLEPDWAKGVDNYGSISQSCEFFAPAFVDLNDDSRLDLLLGCDGQLLWYSQGGPLGTPVWTFETDGYMNLFTSSGLSPGLGDWDNDGDLDLVTGEHWGVRRFFLNQLNEVTADWQQTSFEFPFDLQGDSAPALADFWNNDGIPDLLIGQVHGNVERYDNHGSGTTPDWSFTETILTLPWTDHPHPFPALGDLNGDGKIDLLLGEGAWPEGSGAGGTLKYYENTGTISSPVWTNIITDSLGFDVGGWSTPALVDINDDNDLDLFIGNEDGYITYIENAGNLLTPDWAVPSIAIDFDFGSYAAPAFFDIDQDGDLDMLVGLGDGTLTHVENVGTSSIPEWEVAAEFYQRIDVGLHATPAAADLDGDGLLDLVLGSSDGGLQLYLYEEPGIPEAADPAIYQPSDLVKSEGILKFHSQAITATTDVEAITVWGGVFLQKMFNADGSPIAANNSFMSTMLTPSGFPIQEGRWSDIDLKKTISLHDLQHSGGNTIAGSWNVTFQLPSELDPGIYRPKIFISASGVPTSSQWLAANVTNFLVASEFITLPPIQVGETGQPNMIWRLLMDDFIQGTRGTGAQEDGGKFELASQIVSQGADYYLPPVDLRTGQPITYRLEPFLPMISYTDRRLPGQPALPLKLPGGKLCVNVHAPSGNLTDLGCETFSQSFNRTKTTRAGLDLNVGTIQLDDVYSLKVLSDRFRYTFEEYGHYIIEMAGFAEDPWGNIYPGGGTYDIWVAHPLDMDPGILPGTPLTIGDEFNQTIQFSPRVPATVSMTVRHFPASNPDLMESYHVDGNASEFGFFNPAGSKIILDSPGEFRVDVTARYSDTDGVLYMGSMVWGSVVATPQNEAQLIAHGRRGLDSLVDIPGTWFRLSSLTVPEGAISHAFNPYLNGDILWSRFSDGAYGGDSLLIVASIQDTIGIIANNIESRLNKMGMGVPGPGSFSDRLAKQELPLFTSTRSGNPPELILGQIGADVPEEIDQIAYSYRSSQRPGTRVREIVSEDTENGGYWRLDTLYDDQLSVGVLGDQPNDFKLQYVGAVYRDLESGLNEYVIQGSGWIFIPDSDATGSRVMPPFAGPGNGGWTTEGGPILTLKGKEIHMFILPTAVRPGSILEQGERFTFGGHLMPTLDSKVAVTVTAPSGATQLIDGQANSIGYYYDSDDSFVVDEPGTWFVDVRVWHDGQIGDGSSVDCDPNQPGDPSRPCPSGDILGSASGRYEFYVLPLDAPNLGLTSPSPGLLSFPFGVHPVTISGIIPPDLENVTVDYTITMPGYILKQGKADIYSGTFSFIYDPESLHDIFSNLDLMDRDDGKPGLSDSINISILLRGENGAETIYRGNSVFLQGEQVYIGVMNDVIDLYLPLIKR